MTVSHLYFVKAYENTILHAELINKLMQPSNAKHKLTMLQTHAFVCLVAKHNKSLYRQRLSIPLMHDFVKRARVNKLDFISSSNLARKGCAKGMKFVKMTGFLITL